MQLLNRFGASEQKAGHLYHAISSSMCRWMVTEARSSVEVSVQKMFAPRSVTSIAARVVS